LLRSAIEPTAASALAQRNRWTRKAHSYITQARIPLPERLETYNLLSRLGAQSIFEPEFLASVDIDSPARMQQARYAETADYSLINRMLAYDFKFTLLDSDLPKVTRMCDAAGVDVAFPMLDDAVVAFASRLRPDMKLRGTKLRWFFKAALADFLPREIIAKTKHGFGLPFGVWLTQEPTLAIFARDQLEHLKRRGIVRPTIVDDLWSRLLPSHPGYYGTMIWLLLMLELWFRENVDTLPPGGSPSFTAAAPEAARTGNGEAVAQKQAASDPTV
jgi:asparagine synthase (glutamine-hydrolysing)